MKGYYICLTLKTLKYKPYSNLQSLLIPSHCWKDLPINFVRKLQIFNNPKSDNYDLFFMKVE